MYKFVFFISTFNMQSTHTHTVHTPPALHWKNRKNNKRNSRKNNELFSRKNTKILHFTFQYEIFIDFKDKLSNNMEMHLHNTGRRVRRGTGGRGSCQYEGEKKERQRETQEEEEGGARLANGHKTQAGKCNPSQAKQTSGKHCNGRFTCIGYGKWPQLATAQERELKPGAGDAAAASATASCACMRVPQRAYAGKPSLPFSFSYLPLSLAEQRL